MTARASATAPSRRAVDVPEFVEATESVLGVDDVEVVGEAAGDVGDVDDDVADGVGDVDGGVMVDVATAAGVGAAVAVKPKEPEMGCPSEEVTRHCTS